MYRLRGLVAAGFVLATGIAAVSCGGSDASPPSDGTGGTPGTGGADASAMGAGGASQVDGGSAGGASPLDGGSAGGATAGGATGVDSGLTALLNCGNGTPDPGEQCDDGNNKNGDGCDNNCKYSCVKECTDGNFCDGPETCSADHVCLASTAPLPDGTICGTISTCQGGKCQLAPANCGDTLVVAPEECDPPDGTSCSATCQFICVSSDPKRNCQTTDPCAAPESCDDTVHTCNVAGSPAKDLVSCGNLKACVSGVCTDKYCSNGVKDPGEECDDGNRIEGDGCDNDCKYSCDPADSTRNCKNGNACIIDGVCDTVTTHKCSPSTPEPAGSACGTKQNCLQGNCIAPKCGDGIVASGVELCDDGNAVNGDGCDNDCTPSCVNPLTDCPAPPACRIAVCTNSKCDSAKDDTKNGNTCDTGGGAATCKAGACTTGTCGDGVKDPGEVCDDHNLVAGDGCEPNCTYTCTQNSQCNDADPCDGIETCDTTVAHKCTNPSNMSDGTPCGTGKVCISAECRPSLCGDGVVSPPEECDPPNTLGCDSTCKARAICDLRGTWAMKVSANVSWGDNAGGTIILGTGAIQQWAKLTITQTTPTLTATLQPCGISIPDFQTNPTLGSETYGLIFPQTDFDAATAKFPSIKVTGTVSSPLIGATFDTDAIAILLGITFDSSHNPITDPWPDVANMTAANGFAITDVDGDGNPGLTAVTKSGGSYSDVPVDISGGLSNIIRGDQLYLVVRQVASQSGTVNSCIALSGVTDVTKIDNHIVGCQTDSKVTCTPDQANLPDAVRPLYVIDPVKKGAFTAQKLTGTGPVTCATVKSTLP